MLWLLTVVGCTEHGKPEVEVEPSAPEAKVEEDTPEQAPEPEERLETFTCKRTAYLIAEQWRGTGQSTVSMEEARQRADDEGCKAAGQALGCVDGERFVSAKGSSSSRSQFVNGEMSKEFEVGVRLVAFERSAPYTHETPEGALRACETAKQMACRELGEPGCPPDKVLISDPPPRAHPFAAGQSTPSNQSAN